MSPLRARDHSGSAGQTGAPQATPLRVAVGFALIAAAAAFLTYSAWTHDTFVTALSCVAIATAAIGLYYAGVARGATR